MPSVLMMAGGTGGHIFPALAVADVLKKAGWHVHWLGTKHGLETRLVKQHGYPLHCIDIHGLRGKGRLSLLFAPFKIARAIAQAWALLGKIKPAAVVGMGGYATGPGGVAAKLRGLPLLIHEQNAIAGLTNRWLAKIATVVMQAFDGALPGAITTGNPVRQELFDAHQPNMRAPSERLNILVVGGSLGAKAINECVVSALKMLPAHERPNVWHQTGAHHLDDIKQQYKNADIESNVSAFIDDMNRAYEWADWVVCRSGALTVSEISAAGVAALFVPFPFAVDDHQTANANYLVARGGAQLCQQKALTPSWLATEIQKHQQDRNTLKSMAANARMQAKESATTDVVEHIKRVSRV